ncbi:MAG: hypothetical protein ACRD1B_01165 [Thermoanaerobaculia bacterium]
MVRHDPTRPGLILALAQLKELIGGIDRRLDADATAELDSAIAWKNA